MLVALLFGLLDLIPELGHLLHLDVAFGSFAQLIHAIRVFFFLHRLLANLLGLRARNMECNATSGLRLQIWTTMRPNLSMNFRRDSSSACRRLATAAMSYGVTG